MCTYMWYRNDVINVTKCKLYLTFNYMIHAHFSVLRITSEWNSVNLNNCNRSVKYCYAKLCAECINPRGFHSRLMSPKQFAMFTKVSRREIRFSLRLRGCFDAARKVFVTVSRMCVRSLPPLTVSNRRSDIPHARFDDFAV